MSRGKQFACSQLRPLLFRRENCGLELMTCIRSRKPRSDRFEVKPRSVCLPAQTLNRHYILPLHSLKCSDSQIYCLFPDSVGKNTAKSVRSNSPLFQLPRGPFLSANIIFSSVFSLLIHSLHCDHGDLSKTQI